LKKELYIVFLLVLLSGCGTIPPPIDDAYYWPDKRLEVEYVVQPSNATSAAPASPGIEYINVQDTTVTIRINK